MTVSIRDTVRPDDLGQAVSGTLTLAFGAQGLRQLRQASEQADISLLGLMAALLGAALDRFHSARDLGFNVLVVGEDGRDSRFEGRGRYGVRLASRPNVAEPGDALPADMARAIDGSREAAALRSRTNYPRPGVTLRLIRREGQLAAAEGWCERRPDDSATALRVDVHEYADGLVAACTYRAGADATVAAFEIAQEFVRLLGTQCRPA